MAHGRKHSGLSRAITVFLAAGLAAYAAAPGQAQDQSGLEAALQAELAAARQSGVAAPLLEQKIAEGRLKQVPPERLVLAIRQYRERLVQGRELLPREWQGAPECQRAAAELLLSGLGREDLAELARRDKNAGAGQRDQAAFTRKATVLNDLVLRGVPAAQAAEVLRAAAQPGPAAGNHDQAAQAIQQRIGQGEKPEQAATEVIHSLREGRPMFEPRAEQTRGRGFGNRPYQVQPPETRGDNPDTNRGADKKPRVAPKGKKESAGGATPAGKSSSAPGQDKK